MQSRWVLPKTIEAYGRSKWSGEEQSAPKLLVEQCQYSPKWEAQLVGARTRIIFRAMSMHGAIINVQLASSPIDTTNTTCLIFLDYYFLPTGTSFPGDRKLAKCRSVSAMVTTGTQKQSTSWSDIDLQHWSAELPQKSADIGTCIPADRLCEALLYCQSLSGKVVHHPPADQASQQPLDKIHG